MKPQKYVEIFKALVPPKEEWLMRNFHATFAIWGNKLIAIGINKNKTHPLNLKNRKKNSSGMDYSDSKFSCSELVCLNMVRRKTDIAFNKITLLNFRQNREGKLAMAKCCKGCESLVSFLGVRKVYYTNDSGEFESYQTFSLT